MRCDFNGNLFSYLIVINPIDTKFSLWLAQREIQSIQFIEAPILKVKQ